jgi:vitamin B12/bleomycin/antimicrobial peptide transport system ATP-binding/permease protein
MSESASRSFISFSSHRKRDVVSRFWAVSGGFWHGSTQKTAFFYTFGLAAGLILVLFVNIGINRWQSALFNALEAKDQARAFFALSLVPLLVLGGAGAGALVVYMRETLQVLWREFTVRALVARWISGDRYRSIQEQGREPPNPEYRIADDVRVSLDPLVDFAIGFFSAGLALVAFIGILWTVGGSQTVTIGSTSVTIPAFMVLAAILYGVIVTSATVWVGRPLVDAIAHRNESEARLRFDLTRVREHAENVRAKGEAGQAHAAINETYDSVVERSRRIVKYHTRITWFTNGNGVLVPLVAIVLATPKYLAGGLSLGDLVSLGAAFLQTQMAFSWLVDNFRQVALWYASAGRVVDVIDALQDVPPSEPLHVTPSEPAPATSPAQTEPVFQPGMAGSGGPMVAPGGAFVNVRHLNDDLPVPTKTPAE